MTKDKLKSAFYSYTDFSTLKNIGDSLIGQLRGYFTLGSWIKDASLYWVALQAVNSMNVFGFIINTKWIQFWMIVLFLIVKFYLMIFIDWLGGKIAIRIGLYNASLQYSAKSEHLSPYNLELIRQLEAIGEKLGIESKFTKL